MSIPGMGARNLTLNESYRSGLSIFRKGGNILKTKNEGLHREPHLVGVKEAGAILDLSAVTIRRMAWTRELPSVRVAKRSLKFEISSLLKYIEDRKIPQKED